MKIGIGADTGDFDKGARKVKQEMRDLDKVSSNAFAAIGAALGVDVGKIQQFSSALQGLGYKLGETGRAGESAFKGIANSISPVAAGIAGLGIGAAIAAFKQLNAEADAFEKTIQGGAIAAQTEAYLSVFRQALRDQSGAGEGFSNFRSTLKQAGATLAGFFQSGFDLDKMKEANTAADRAKEIAGELYEIELKRKENSVRVSQLDAEIAKQREIISDTTKSAKERAEALALAQDLIKQKLGLQLSLEQQKRDLLVEYNGLSSTTIKEYDAEIAAKISVNNLIQQEAAEQRQLLRQQNSINAALEKEKETREAIAASRASLKDWAEQATDVADITTQAAVQIPVGLAIPESAKQQLEKDIMDITSSLQGMAVSMSEAIGSLAADLINGEDAWGNFANAAMSSFGDMAIAIGKVAIEAGIAASGISALLKNPDNWYLAVAAGVALVALGAAVKTGLSNIASGNYSAGTNAGTGSYSAGSSNYERRDVYVNVTGTLQADGDQLLVVINNAEKKNYLTT